MIEEGTHHHAPDASQDATLDFDYEEKRLIKKTIDEPVEHVNMLDEIEEMQDNFLDSLLSEPKTDPHQRQRSEVIDHHFQNLTERGKDETRNRKGDQDSS